MSLALEQAIEAELAGEVPVGAVVVKNGTVIARGRNRTIEWNDPSAHAEVVALKEAANFCGTHRMSGLALFVTLEPCAMCSGAIFHSRIERVVYGAPDPKTGCAGSVLNLFAMDKLNHHTKVSGGVLSKECSDILVRFFERSRAKKNATLVPVREDSLRTPEAAFTGLLSHHIPGFFYSGSDRFRMHYRDLHPALASKTVLCLHDFPYWSEQLVPLMSKLASAGYRTMSPDLIGCGLSDKPKKAAWHSDEAHARILFDLFAHLKVIPNIVIAIGGSVNIALVLGQDERWISTKFVHVDRSLGMMSMLGISNTHPATGTTGVWNAGSSTYLSGLSPNTRRVVQAPFPDAGHAAILKGMLHSSFIRRDAKVLIRLVHPASSNLFELEPEIEKALLYIAEHE